MEVGAKICLICGVNANKIEKYNRYNVVPLRKKGKSGKDDEVSSDSDDSSSKAKKKAPPSKSWRQPTGASSRQTRNQNPKSFAASLCKAMDLPDDPEHPFLLIFSRADYCTDCMTKVKDIHTSQMELEKIQKKLSEYRVDIELDMSKHLQKIPFCSNVLRNEEYCRYREDLDQILDFHGTDKKNESLYDEADDDDDQGKRSQRRKDPVAEKVAELKDLKLKLKLKRKLEDESEEISTEPVVKQVCKTEVAGDENAVTAEIETNGASEKIDVDNGSNPLPSENVGEEMVCEEPPKPIKVKVKKDPNLKCPNCAIPRYFNSAETLEEHVARAHADRRKQICDICEEKFLFKKELQAHKLKVHDIVDESLGWTCGFCDKDFAQKRYLEDHLDRHQEAKPLNCQFCGGGFARKESLQKAFQIYKGETVEPCRKCGRNLNLKDYLEHNRKIKDQ